jgi:CDP-4-dehydro-6-deoxyglucose reductase
LKVLRCPIDSIEYYNHDTRQIFLNLPVGESIEFKAGQYLEVLLPGRKCPFSIASAPSLKHQIELHIRPTPNSEDSVAIEEFLDRADHIDVEIPRGDCYLTEPPSGPLLLMAASTGITQMKSIIEHITPDGLTHPVYLYWGVVSEKDLYINELCQSWVEQHENFHYYPVVSDPDTSPGWIGKTGLVGEIALADIKDVTNLTAYVSGGPGMVYATLDMLVNAGMPTENMHSDMFSYSPRKN